MHKTIISDTSCFIVLTNINQTDFRLGSDVEKQALKESGEEE